MNAARLTAAPLLLLGLASIPSCGTDGVTPDCPALPLRSDPEYAEKLAAAAEAPYYCVTLPSGAGTAGHSGAAGRGNMAGHAGAAEPGNDGGAAGSDS